ncbi:hypothetical protein AAFF_G00038860 [Aldrovandia affinis]|uniref:Uncharacterized protein n=1 Tax=Aldrovandia affinis TaxID=143900 RepID=A0AAD7T5C6_9TELE|nr:hypothetical protein AAFF_G00038860 [Aldrovandia affinis]
MSCGYEGMYNARLSVMLWRRPLLSIKLTSASPLRSAIPLLLVPSANSTQCISAWNLSSNFLNFAMSVMICKVAPVSTIRPFILIPRPGWISAFSSFVAAPCCSPPRKLVARRLAAVSVCRLRPDVWRFYTDYTTACIDMFWLCVPSAHI